MEPLLLKELSVGFQGGAGELVVAQSEKDAPALDTQTHCSSLQQLEHPASTPLQ